ncbi:toxin-antitoxin system HicB family antitoxin [Amnibacterium sp.]|uniref:toxin-antitoxin system HicB family antitoxin n=1 Tax=Amnibacterium sp. TaxID=1872496 RepID=UPI00261B3FC3|nr:toxin-antitoxin system HicB family antitoxin [Amnibacterium sp.]MCU1474893.1 response regulator receiver [Amnibacterium sp.]
MELERYVAELQEQLAKAVIGDEAALAVAERMSGALDAAVRLVLLEVLSDAAGEITRELAPGSVDVRLRGRDPELLVSHGASSQAEAPVDAGDLTDDATTSRTTLRLPDRLKAEVEAAAAAEGVSVNAWLVRAIAAAVGPKGRRPGKAARNGDSFTGWVR